MKQTIAVCIAHPDDEAFGPSGTIAKLAKEGNDVYILCATKGEAGENRHPTDKGPLYSIREKELQESAQTLGVKKVFFLGFEDGTLSNNLYHKISKKILDIFKVIKPSTIITNEYLGVSGHLDHMAIAMISTYVFYHFAPAKTIWYHCVLKNRIKKMTELYGEYFVYRPPGYELSQVDKTVDVSSEWDIKTKAIHCHVSQLKDVNRVLHMMSLFPKKEYFFELNK